MISPELVEYVRLQRVSGKNDTEIRQALFTGGGWTQSDIDEVMNIPKSGSANSDISSGMPVVNKIWFLLQIPFSFALLSVIFLFFAHFKSHTSEGSSILLDLNSGDYMYYGVLLAIVSFLLYRHSDKAIRVLVTTGVVVFLIQARNYIFYGLALFLIEWPIIVFIILIAFCLYGMQRLIKYLVDRDEKYSMFVLLGIILIFDVAAGYVNAHDLGVKNHIIYKNNSMFETIEECDAYLMPTRRSDCRSDFNIMHERWAQLDQQMTLNQVKADPSLNINQNPNPTSNNYQYFPAENISDVKIGDGKTAIYNDVASVDITSADYNGKTYSDNSFKNVQIWLTVPKETRFYPSYENYKLGVIGMKVGGIRKITFKTPEGIALSRTDYTKSNTAVTFTVELISLEAASGNPDQDLPHQSPGFQSVK